MYIAIKKLLTPFFFLPYKHTKKTDLFEKLLNIKLFKAICFGGGTLINTPSYLKELEVAQKKYNNTFVVGAGVRDPEFWSRIESNSNCVSDWVEKLKVCKFVGVRGPISNAILQDHGFKNAVVTGDPALYLAKDSYVKKRRIKKMGINIGRSNGRAWADDLHVLDTIVKYSKVMINKGWEISFLPVFNEDIAFIREAVVKIGRPLTIFDKYHSIEKVQDYLQGLDFFVGEKLHSVVLALGVNTPSIMLEYRPKCLDFMASMDLQKFNIRLDRLSVDLLLEISERLCTNVEQVQDRIAHKIRYYKNMQHNMAQTIKNIILNS